MNGVIERIDELISEAEKEPSWTATQALRCLRKELLNEPAIPTKWIYEYLDKLERGTAEHSAVAQMFVAWRKDEEKKDETD